MFLKKYCAVFFNPDGELDKEVIRIADSDYNKMGGTGISIYTFTSGLDIPMLTDFFKSFDRNFLVFDLDKESSGFNIMDKEKENLLFGFLNDIKSNPYESLSNELLDDFFEETIPKNQTGYTPNLDYVNVINKSNDDVINYNNLTKEEINQELNKIIDKGVNNLTDTDKKILDKLSNLI